MGCAICTVMALLLKRPEASTPLRNSMSRSLYCVLALTEAFGSSPASPWGMRSCAACQDARAAAYAASFACARRRMSSRSAAPAASGSSDRAQASNPNAIFSGWDCGRATGGLEHEAFGLRRVAQRLDAGLEQRLPADPAARHPADAPRGHHRRVADDGDEPSPGRERALELIGKQRQRAGHEDDVIG